MCGEEIKELLGICDHWDCFDVKTEKFCYQCGKGMKCDAVHVSFGYGSKFDGMELDFCSDVCHIKWVRLGGKKKQNDVHYARYSDTEEIHFFVPCLELQSTVPKYGCDGELYYSNNVKEVTCKTCLARIRKRKSSVNDCGEAIWKSWRKYQKSRGLGECGEALK